MNWTYAGNVLVTVGGVLSTVWVLGRILRPWMRDDMRTMEAGLREDMRAMGTSLGDRIGRSETRIMAVLARLAEPSAQGPPALAPPKTQADAQ